MKVKRGDVVLTHYPLAAGTGLSRRPVLVVQSDVENQRLKNTIVAQITTNLTRLKEPTHLLIESPRQKGPNRASYTTPWFPASTWPRFTKIA